MADGIEQGGQSIAAGILSAAKQMRADEEARVKALLTAGQQHPEILDDPNVYKTIRDYTRDDTTAKALIETSRSKSLPGQAVSTLGAMGVPEQTIRQTVAPGSIPLPAGEPGPVQPAPTQTELGQAALGSLPEIAAQRGFGVDISPTRGISIRQAPPTRVEVGEMSGLQAWQGVREQLADSGLPPDKVDVLASRLTLSAMAKSGQIPPPWMRDMALASTDTAIAAARESAIKTAGAQVTQQFAAGTATETARGTAIGGAQARRAEAETAAGAPGARNLGQRPSLQQLSIEAQQGSQLIVDSSGNIIALPSGETPTTGEGPKGVPAATAAMKPELIQGYNSMRSVMTDLSDPKIAALFPSEKDYGRVGARIKGMTIERFTRQFTDPAAADAAIRRLAEMRVQAERLAIGGVPRAQGIVDLLGNVSSGIENRSYTREQFGQAMNQLNTMLGELGPQMKLEVRGGPQQPKEGTPAAGTPAPVRAAPPPEQGTSIGDKQNNPGHVKSTAFTRRLPGYVGDGKAATDGGKFAIFDSAESGRNAIDAVLTRVHGSKSVATALNQYSGGGYDVNKVAADAGVNPRQTIASLTPDQRSTLIDSMIGAEGSSTGLSREARAARYAKLVNDKKMTAEEAARRLRPSR
jgi:hypothetical protein